jgi:ribosome biogenesis GTPase / thiamine phosphate phosphatase
MSLVLTTEDCRYLDGVMGMVTAIQANFYRVWLDQPGLDAMGGPIPTLLCTRRARLKKLGQQIMVGDRVLVEEPDWSGQRGAICEVCPRRSELQRPPVANADQILLVFSIAQPTLDVQQLSRFLVTAEQTQLRLQLALSKTDLVSAEVVASWCDRLQGWGYDPVPLSLVNQQGIEAIAQRLHGKLSVVCGPSGVGKSSLINHLIPAVELRVGAVSERWHQGRHTTRHVELFELPEQGLLADTPGFNQPDIQGVPTDLGLLFPEVRAQLATGPCQFGNCLHRGEPGCGVGQDWDRAGIYQTLLAELEQASAQPQALAKVEAALKPKASRHGQIDYEPRLEQKKYRRHSRRSQRQELEDLYREELH